MYPMHINTISIKINPIHTSVSKGSSPVEFFGWGDGTWVTSNSVLSSVKIVNDGDSLVSI